MNATFKDALRTHIIARQTLMEFPNMLPGGEFEEVNGFPFTTYMCESEAAARDIETKVSRFETVQCDVDECPGGKWRVQIYPRS